MTEHVLYQALITVRISVDEKTVGSEVFEDFRDAAHDAVSGGDLEDLIESMVEAALVDTPHISVLDWHAVQHTTDVSQYIGKK